MKVLDIEYAEQLEKLKLMETKMPRVSEYHRKKDSIEVEMLVHEQKLKRDLQSFKNAIAQKHEIEKQVTSCSKYPPQRIS